MELQFNRFVRGIVSLALMTAATVAGAESSLCAPFANSVVDTTIMENMLSSARDGHLYRIQPASSRVGFCVDSQLGRVEGRFSEFQGGLTYVPTAEEQQALVRVDTRSLATGTPFIDGRLKGEQFFDVDKYPEMLFVSRHFHWVNHSEAVLIGDLTLHGVTHQVGFHVSLVDNDRAGARQAGESIRVKATALISRSAFGLDALSPLVSDAVSLCMSVDAVRYRSI